MRTPGIAQTHKSRFEPVFTSSLFHQRQEPFLETRSDHSGRAVHKVVARSENWIIPLRSRLRPSISQINTDRLYIWVAKLEPAFRLDPHLRDAGERDHWSDRRKRMNQWSVLVKTVRDHQPCTKSRGELIAVPTLPGVDRGRVGAWPAGRRPSAETRRDLRYRRKTPRINPHHCDPELKFAAQIAPLDHADGPLLSNSGIRDGTCGPESLSSQSCHQPASGAGTNSVVNTRPNSVTAEASSISIGTN